MNSQSKSHADNRYWCDTEGDPKKLAMHFRTRIDRFYDWCNTSGRARLWYRVARMFYGLDADATYRSSAYVQLEGAQGQDLGFVTNYYRSFIRTLVALTTGSRPAFAARPIAYDASTTETVTIANAYMDREMDNGLEERGAECVVKNLNFGEGWLLTTWDDAAGKMIGEEPVVDENGQPTGDVRPIATGGTRILSLRPDQVIRDPDVTGDANTHQWLAASVQRNRWDLMRQYPLYADEIHDAPTIDPRWLFGLTGGGTMMARNINNDCVQTYELYHKKTFAMPDGLFALMVGTTIVSMGPLPYDDLPFDAMMPDRDPGTSMGYAQGWDLMAPQTLASSVVMQMGTNRENFGRPNIWLPTGCIPEPYDVGGPRLLQGGVSAPVVIDMSTGGVESGERFLELALTTMQRLSGISDATMGNVGSSASGVAIAQQQENTAMFNGPTTSSYGRMLQGAMTKLLRIAQRFMPDEQLIHIAGKLHAPMVKRFKAQDFASIDGISVELGSAAMRSSGARHSIATELLQANQIQNPQIVEAFVQFIATGRTEPLLDGARARETQCERLMLEAQEGRPYIVAATMPHAMMIDRLTTVLADPSMDAERAQVAQTLIQQHSELWMTLSSNPMGIGILAATGQVPHPAAQMMAPPAPGTPMQGPGASETAPPAEDAPPDNQDVPDRANAPAPSPSGANTSEMPANGPTPEA